MEIDEDSCLDEKQKLRPLEDFLSPEARRFMEDAQTPVFPLVEDVYSIGVDRKWFVVYTNPKCEGKAEGGISAERYSAYSPKTTTWRKRSRRLKHQKAPRVKISRPLFTRYLFVELPIYADGAAPFGAVRTVGGVQEFVAAAGFPLAARGTDIASIQEREELGIFDETVKHGRVIAPRWAVAGARCLVTDGPFASFPGTIIECLPHDRVKVDVEIFGRATPVELELEQIKEE